MLRSNRNGWASGIGAAVLLGGLVLASYGSGVTPAGAATNDPLSNGGAGNHTLRWDTSNPSDSRFTMAFRDAVLDKNTGLVWEQTPDGTSRTWDAATIHCLNRVVGGAVGWRLPSVVELKSVQDPTLQAPFVPASAFTLSKTFTTPGVQLAAYWSATLSTQYPTHAWGVGFNNGAVDRADRALNIARAWCVRGGMHADQY